MAYRATAHDVTDVMSPIETNTKVYFHMARSAAPSLTVQMCALLKSQCPLFKKFCMNGCLFTYFILSLCQFAKKCKMGSTKRAIVFEFAVWK